MVFLWLVGKTFQGVEKESPASTMEEGAEIIYLWVNQRGTQNPLAFWWVRQSLTSYSQRLVPGVPNWIRVSLWTIWISLWECTCACTHTNINSIKGLRIKAIQLKPASGSWHQWERVAQKMTTDSSCGFSWDMALPSLLVRKGVPGPEGPG